MVNTARLKKQLQNDLSHDRFIHTLNVAETALELAQVYKINSGQVELAALLHDCARDYSDEQLLQMAHQLGIKVDKIQENIPAMLHGPVGAELARQKYGIEDEEVLSAIAVHTTGKEDMNDAAKVLMIADAIEPNRKYNGVAELRKQVKNCGDDLDQAVMQCLEFKIKIVLKYNCLLHPSSVMARNDLLLKIKSKK